MACLLDASDCVSGKADCVPATMNEIGVLLNALESPVSVVRDAALRGLFGMSSSFPTYEQSYDDALRINKRIWVACYDVNEDNRFLLSLL